VDIRGPVERSAAATLLALAGLHAVWATGSSWPAKDRVALAELMAGRAGGSVPPAAACTTVATLLTIASVLVSGRPRRLPALQRAGAHAVAAVLGVRGACGMAGRTDLVSPGSTAPRFWRMDRRYYSPLCLALAAAAASSATA
jgi:uncharacterized protein DUF3995